MIETEIESTKPEETKPEIEYPYQVMHPNGERILHAPICCRYEPSIEYSMLTNHYRIFIGEHEITIEEVEARLAAEEEAKLIAEKAAAEAVERAMAQVEKPKRTRRKKETTSV